MLTTRHSQRYRQTSWKTFLLISIAVSVIFGGMQNEGSYCGKVAAKIGNGMRSVDVYRTAIQRAADDTMWIPARVPRGRADEMKERWERNGEGWLAIPLNSGYEPYTDFRLFQGSSTYDTRQMGRLIDELISEAENLGIDALTPGEKARMMSEWEK